MKPFALSGGLLLVCHAQARILQLPLQRLDPHGVSVSLKTHSKSYYPMSKSAEIIVQRFPDLRTSGEQDGQDYLKSIKDQRLISKSPSQLVAQDDTHQLPVRVSLPIFNQVIIATQPHHIGLGTSALPHHNCHRHSTPILHSSNRHRLDRSVRSICKM